MPMQLKCPNCQSTIFHRAVFVSIIDGQEVENRREYRCPVCNGQYAPENLEQFVPVGDSYRSMIAEGQAAAVAASQIMNTEDFLAQVKDK